MTYSVIKDCTYCAVCTICWLNVLTGFLSRVSILTRDIDIAIMFVCPSILPLRSGILWKWLQILL